ncbi:MAG TPA: DUF3267 domain-containing protein [Niabella sp.]|jgi:hypothetical protein|nr:DUF3267 domain-containing protein [Niabella sp.]
MEENRLNDEQFDTGYEKVLKIIDIVKANNIGLKLLIPTILIYGLPFYLIWKDSISFKDMFSADSGWVFLKWLTIFLAGIVAHELVHGITWALYAKKGFRSIKFGILWKYITPYCHCKEPLQIRHYLIGAITPFIFVGLLPAVYAIITGSINWLLFGIFYTVGAVGDFLIIKLLLPEKRNDYALDHPSEAGCYVYRKIPA